MFLLSYCLSQLRDSKDLFTPTFAVSRTSRWTSLYLEQYGNNRLIRLRAEGEYVGPKKNKLYSY